MVDEVSCTEWHGGTDNIGWKKSTKMVENGRKTAYLIKTLFFK
jgi:hypothetical protein